MKYILSHADSKVSKNILVLSQKNHQTYAELCGYVSFFDTVDTQYGDRDSRWRKIELLLNIMEKPEVDLIVWVDYDAFFLMTAHVSIDEYIEQLPSEGSIYFSKSPPIPGTPYINSGVFIIRNNSYSKKFFLDVWNKGVLNESEYRISEYGFSCPGGDQNTIIYTLFTKYASSLGRDIHIVDSLYFNARPEDMPFGPNQMIVHVAGGNKEERIKRCIEFI